MVSQPNRPQIAHRFYWLSLAVAGVIVAGVFSGWKGAAAYAAGYLAVIVFGYLLLRRRKGD
jgi:hypothetical protein